MVSNLMPWKVTVWRLNSGHRYKYRRRPLLAWAYVLPMVKIFIPVCSCSQQRWLRSACSGWCSPPCCSLVLSPSHQRKHMISWRIRSENQPGRGSVTTAWSMKYGLLVRAQYITWNILTPRPHSGPTSLSASEDSEAAGAMTSTAEAAPPPPF